MSAWKTYLAGMVTKHQSLSRVAPPPISPFHPNVAVADSQDTTHQLTMPVRLVGKVDN
jgi:hypothetical protein